MKTGRKYLNTYIILILILFIGTAVRLAFFQTESQDFRFKGDEKNYQIMSYQIVDNGIYGYGLGRKSGKPNAYVTPGYPLLLALVYSIFHVPHLQVTIIRLLQVFIGGLATPLLACLCIRKLFKRDGVALLTSFFIAIYPTYIVSATHMLTEVCSLAAMLLYFYILTISLELKKPYLSAISGIIFAVNILIRPTMLPLIIIPYVFAFFTVFRHDRKMLYKLFALHIAGFAAAMLPWWLRNYAVLHKLILLSTGSGDPLLAGTYPNMANLFGDYLSSPVRVSEGSFARKRIIEGFMTRPLLYLKWYTIGKIQFMFQKPWLLLYPHRNTMLNSVIYSLMPVVHNILIYIGSIGAVIGSAANKSLAFVNLYALLFLGLLLIFIPESRYAYMHMAFLMFATAFIICRLAEYIKSMVIAGTGK